MKKILFTIAGSLFICLAFSQEDNKNRQENYQQEYYRQENNPPSNIRESFQKEYPQSRPANWYRSDKGWSVNFEDKDYNNGYVTVYLDRDGNIEDTHVPYDMTDVPPVILDNLHSRYLGSDNYDFNWIQRPREENGVYEVHFRHPNGEKTIYMDENGVETQYEDMHSRYFRDKYSKKHEEKDKHERERNENERDK